MKATIIRALAVPPLAVLLLLSLYSCAKSQSILMPPEEWRKMPYDGKLTVEVVPSDQTHEKCGYGFPRMIPGTRGYTMACAYRRLDSCKIVFPDNANGAYSTRLMEELWEHELAHCKGWNHEQ